MNTEQEMSPPETLVEIRAGLKAFPMDRYAYATMISEWLEIKDSEAPFNELQLCRELGVANDFGGNVERQRISEALKLLVFAGKLKKVENRFGFFRLINKDLEKIDYMNASEAESDLWLPFDITDLLRIYPGLIVIAGNPNAGKTSICLNIARENQNKGWDVHYFQDEMSPTEFKVRLLKFPFPIESWEINAYQRSGDYEDVVKSGPNDLNIIDYVTVYTDFFAIGGVLNEIAKASGEAITIVCIQKNPGQDTGLGGQRTLERCRIALSLEYGKVKIVKGKSVRDPEKNPFMAHKKFDIYDSHNLTWRDGWMRDKE